MSSSNAVFVRSTLFMLGLGVLALIGIIGASLWLTSANRIYSDNVAEIRRIRTGSVDLLTALQDAETGQRGFLLTNDESYLSPYYEAVKSLPERRKRLADVLQNFPDYADKLPALDQAVDGKMAEIDNTVALARAGRLQEAVAIVRNDSGKRFMDSARGVLVGFIGRTDDRLRVVVGEQLNAASNLQWVTIGGALAIAIVVGGAILIIVQHVRDLSRAR